MGLCLTLHVGQLFRAGPLHLEDLVVAGSVVERVGPLGEVVHDVVVAQVWDPGRVVPGDGQEVLVGDPTGVVHLGWTKFEPGTSELGSFQ